MPSKTKSRQPAAAPGNIQKLEEEVLGHELRIAKASVTSERLERTVKLLETKVDVIETKLHCMLCPEFAACLKEGNLPFEQTAKIDPDELFEGFKAAASRAAAKRKK